MNKALVSFAMGEQYEQMLSVSCPTLYKYAKQHNYDVIIPCYKTIKDACKRYGWNYQGRPNQWLKLAAIKCILESYDIVQWVDSDIVINKFDIDINEDFQHSTQTQAFVIHQDKYEGQVPNMGVWSMKHSALEALDNIWNQTDCIHHRWWEQGANIKLMRLDQTYRDSCYALPFTYNIHKNDVRYTGNDSNRDGVILHATMYVDRVGQMKKWVNNDYT